MALESEKKLRGGFYTDAAITSFLARWIQGARPASILEPSCGDGAFLSAIEKAGFEGLQRVTACEIDEEEAEKAAARTGLPVRMLKTDFLRWFLWHAKEERYDAVIGNPPFIRYQYLPEEQQLLAGKIFSQLGLPFTKHTNAWVPFVLCSIRLLNPGGRFAMVLPAEIFHIPHAQSLRRYLAEQCSRVLILDPEEILFGNTLQGTVLVLAEKKRDLSLPGEGVAVVQIENRQALSSDPSALAKYAAYAKTETLEGKWMPVFLSATERALLDGLRGHPGIKPFAEIASVDVGIVTGANQFFLVPDETVEEYGLRDWAHPMFGRSDHVRGLVFREADHQENKLRGLPANFLWFKDGELPENVLRYLRTGEQQDLPSRFKCRTRKPWYTVPSVYSAPVAMLKRAHHFPRLVLNQAHAYSTDTAYRIRPEDGIAAEALVHGFVNSLTCLTAELEGRHYGGGVLELVPSEIERLLVPVTQAGAADLDRADERFRAAARDTDFLRQQDALVLESLGLSGNDQDILHGAWRKLRDRRQRVPAKGEV